MGSGCGRPATGRRTEAREEGSLRSPSADRPGGESTRGETRTGPGDDRTAADGGALARAVARLLPVAGRGVSTGRRSEAGPRGAATGGQPGYAGRFSGLFSAGRAGPQGRLPPQGRKPEGRKTAS